MAVAPDDDVIVDGDTEGLGGVDDLLGHLDVGARGGRVAGGVVVDDPAMFTIYLIYIVFSDDLPKVVPGLGSGV